MLTQPQVMVCLFCLRYSGFKFIVHFFQDKKRDRDRSNERSSKKDKEKREHKDREHREKKKVGRLTC